MRFFRWATCTAAAVAVLAGCGGGGGDAGSTPFGSSGGAGGGTGVGGGISDVTNGQPSQRRMTLTAEQTELAWYEKEEETTITVTVGSTSGNPIAATTRVQFVTEAGVIGQYCDIPASTDPSAAVSQCSVGFKSQQPNRADGWVTVLAWMAGEEAYVDVNGNGRYDDGEPFWDAGEPFLDRNESGVYEAGIDELVIANAVGSTVPGRGDQPCGYKGTPGFETNLSASFIPLSRVNTCDGVWGRSLIQRRASFMATPPP